MDKLKWILPVLFLLLAFGCDKKEEPAAADVQVQEKESVAPKEQPKPKVVKDVNLPIIKPVPPRAAKVRSGEKPEKYKDANDIYILPLEVKASKATLAISGGKVKKIVSSSDENLLSEELMGIYSLPFEPGDKTIRFNVLTAKPKKENTTLAEISGTLWYLRMLYFKNVDTGLIDFAEGTSIKGTSGKIGSIRMNNRQRTVLRLEFSEHSAAIKDIEFWSEDGSKLDIERIGYGGKRKGNIAYLIYATAPKEPLPAKGRITLRLAMQVKEQEFDFKAVNIALD